MPLFNSFLDHQNEVPWYIFTLTIDIMELDIENIGDNMVVTTVDESVASEHELNQSKSELRDVQNKYLKRSNDLEAGKSSIPKDTFAAVRSILLSIEQNFIQIAESDTQKKQNDLLNKG